MSIEFCDEYFTSVETQFEMSFSAKAEIFLTKGIKRIIKEKGEQSQYMKQFISPICLVPKPCNSHKLILSLKRNKWAYTIY